MHPRLQRANRLPSLPTVAVEILRLFNSPDSTIQELTSTIQTDPALAVKILKAANSPRYGARSEITDLRTGITRLGRNHLTPLVLSFSLSSTSLEDPEASELFHDIWLRSFVQATAAEIIAEPHGAAFASEAFTINLLAGIGRLSMLKADASLYARCLQQTQNSVQSLEEAAEELFGISPVALSVDILDDIGLPRRCILAVEQIGGGTLPDDVTESERRLIDVTRTASAVADYLCDEDAGIALLTLEDALADSERSVQNLLNAVQNRLEQSAELFNVDPSTIPSQEELLETALEQLAEFTSMVGTEHHERVPSALLEENGRLKRRVEDLLHEAHIDALTGLYNRNWFESQMAELQAVSRVRQQNFGIAIIDIDHFKNVNDTFGHLAGDRVLREVAQALNKVTRDSENVARYGGEEFVLLLEAADHSGMETVGRRLRDSVASTRICFENNVIAVTVSVGIACGCPGPSDQFSQELFARADAALYEAKHNGRNQVIVDSSLAVGSESPGPDSADSPAEPSSCSAAPSDNAT